jgi:hypothetical protein
VAAVKFWIRALISSLISEALMDILGNPLQAGAVGGRAG